MKATKEKFWELFNYKCESDEWDYKKELHTSTKQEKYNLIKDFLAFSNYGGGYILIGVDEENGFSLVNAKTKIDPASLGDIIETNLGFNIKFDIRYFEIALGKDSYCVGLIYIYPSSEVLTCPKDLTGSNNKNIIVKQDTLTRRNTKSTKANSEDLQKIFNRVNSKQRKDEINSNKLPIFKDERQENNNLWDALKNKYALSSENISTIIRGILWHSKHSKIDFINLVGIEDQRFEKILRGEIMPSLDELVRISNMVDINIKFFFQPHFNGSEPFWKSDLVRYSILKLIQPVSRISIINDIDKFLGSIIYQTANNIYYLYCLIFSKDCIIEDTMINPSIKKAFLDIPELKRPAFILELSRQHYKLLEQILEGKPSRGYTKQEETILSWQLCNSEYLARIFTESIKTIKILDKENFKITFHFWDELINKKIRGRDYDGKNIKMIFSKVKIKL